MPRSQISLCPPAHYKAALKSLHAGLSSDQQAALIQTLDLVQTGDESPFEGLFVAEVDGEIIASTWVQFTPGRAAVVWPPAFDSPAAAELWANVVPMLDARGVALAQILVAATDPINEEMLAVSGFRRLADLAYLTLERSNFGNAVSEAPITFESRANELPDRLRSVIKSSYEGTLDCPELNDLRDPEDVVAGYEAQGRFDPERWYLVRRAAQDVGVLILAEHSPGENWELVYMGVVPEARGSGYGEIIVRHAIEQVRLSTAERLVLAVDERNSLAWDMYRRLGFVMWDRRTVYARLNRQSD